MNLSLLLAALLSLGIGVGQAGRQVRPLPVIGMEKAAAERLLDDLPTVTINFGEYGSYEQCHYRSSGVWVIYSFGKVKSVEVTSGRKPTPGNRTP